MTIQSDPVPSEPGHSIDGAPDVIWLQLHGDQVPDGTPVDYKNEVSWCWHKVHEHDVKYIRELAPTRETAPALSGTTHELKTDPEVFQATKSGTKTCEIRCNDRDFKVGDELWLRETKFTGAQMHMRPERCPLIYTGREERRIVSHVLTGYGLPDGWCCLSLGADREQRPAENFETWWLKEGQFSRAGGGGYEKTFAFNAWNAALAGSGEQRPAALSEATLQSRVAPWMQACFGPVIAADKIERNHRFFEEATECVQAGGMTRSEAHQLVDYTFDRPVGELSQEVGGVMITLAALCLANGLDMHAAGEVELARIWTKVEAIRAKQAAKPKHSPLPASGADRERAITGEPVAHFQNDAADGQSPHYSQIAAEYIGTEGTFPLYRAACEGAGSIPSEADERKAFEAFWYEKMAGRGFSRIRCAKSGWFARAALAVPSEEASHDQT